LSEHPTQSEQATGPDGETIAQSIEAADPENPVTESRDTPGQDFHQQQQNQNGHNFSQQNFHMDWNGANGFNPMMNMANGFNPMMGMMGEFPPKSCVPLQVSDKIQACPLCPA
jgi:hypothetical protein